MLFCVFLFCLFRSSVSLIRQPAQDLLHGVYYQNQLYPGVVGQPVVPVFYSVLGPDLARIISKWKLCADSNDQELFLGIF